MLVSATEAIYRLKSIEIWPLLNTSARHLAFRGRFSALILKKYSFQVCFVVLIKGRLRQDFLLRFILGSVMRT